jgi:hypothetical protein
LVTASVVVRKYRSWVGGEGKDEGTTKRRGSAGKGVTAASCVSVMLWLRLPALSKLESVPEA